MAIKINHSKFRVMYKSKEIILPIIVLLILFITPVWMIYSYAGEYSYFNKLSKEGVLIKAVLKHKEIRIDENKILRLFISDSTENYRFKVGFSTDKYISCEFGVSKDTYYSIGIRDELGVIYPRENPQNCTMPDGVEISKYLLLATLLFAIFILLLAFGFLHYVYRSYKKPDAQNPVKPTTDMGVNTYEIACPRCRSIMTEGYMPTVGGVAWRDNDEPVGIPTMLTGLPGTTFWLKRPLLHAFHCKSCEIITFRYGKYSGS